MGRNLGNAGDFTSRKEDAVREGEAGVVSSLETARGTALPRHYTRRRRAEESEATKLGAHELRGQVKDASALREQFVKLTEEADDLLTGAERKAATTGCLKKENVAQKPEAGNFQVQSKDDPEENDKLNFLLRKCEDITNERDALLKGNQHMAKEREAILLEKRKLQDSALLQEELNILKEQSNGTAMERDKYRSRVQRLTAKCENMKKAMEAQKAETKEIQDKFKYIARLERELSTVRQQCKKITKERNAFVLRAQRNAESRAAILLEKDALTLEVENLRAKIKETHQQENQLYVAGKECQNLKAVAGVYKAEAGWIATNREAMEMSIETLKIETEGLCARCKTILALEKELNALKKQCEDMEKDRKTFVLAAERTKADMEALKDENEALKGERVNHSGKRIADLQTKLLEAGRKHKFLTRSLRHVNAELRRVEANKHAISEENYTLKLEIQNLRARCNDAAPLKA
jgi:chromosome segregation ATPase